MKTTVLIGLCATLLGAPLIARQQYAQTITLGKAIEVALERNYIVKQAENNVERDQASVLAAYGNFAPSLSLSSGWQGGQQFINGVAIGNSDDRSVSASVRADVTIFDGFSNTSSLSSARSTASGTEFTLSRTRQSVVSETQRRYYEVLRTRRLLEVARLNLRYSSQQLDRVRETARLGSASLVNVYQQQAQVGQDELSVVQRESEFAVAKANLSAYLALDVTQDADFNDLSIPSEIDSTEFLRQKQQTADLRALVSRAMEQRLDYLSSRQSLEATTANVTAARASYFPRLSAGASYSLNGRTQRDLTGLKTASEFENLGNSKSFGWSVSLSLPLFSGFQTNASVERALVSRSNAEEGLRQTERTIQVEIKTAVLQLDAAEKTYEAAVKSLQYQDQNLKVNQEKYNVGSGTILDLLFAQNNYTAALSSKINAVYQYLNAKSQLDLAVGSIQQ